MYALSLSLTHTLHILHALTQEHDEPVLAHLTDIKVVYADDKGLVSLTDDILQFSPGGAI